MPEMIPVAIWYNPADGATCSLCWDLISVYQGMPFIVGSAEYWMAMGTFHRNCRWIYIYTVIPISELKEAPPLTDAIPADSKTWGIAYNSFVPLPVLAEKRKRIAERPIKRKEGAIQQGTTVFNREHYQSAKQLIRQLIRTGGLTIDKIYAKIVKKYGVSGIVAYNEAGL